MTGAVTPIKEELGGYAPILHAWARLSRHAEECPQCSEVVSALRKGFQKPPQERLESLCEDGFALAVAWARVCEAERDRFRALRYPHILP